MKYERQCTACSQPVLLLDTPLSEDQRKTANIIAEPCQVLLGVISGTLDYPKLTSGTFSITSEMFSLRRIVLSVVRSLQMTLMPGVQLRLTLDPNLPELAQGDQLRFQQIMQNVTDNVVLICKCKR